MLQSPIECVRDLLQTLILRSAVILAALLARTETCFLPAVSFAGALLALTLSYQFLISAIMRRPIAHEPVRNIGVAIPFVVGWVLMIVGMLSICLHIR